MTAVDIQDRDPQALALPIDLEMNDDMKRVIDRRLILGIGDGQMEADGKVIYTAQDLRVGLYDAKDLV